jgi:O-antigen ligase
MKKKKTAEKRINKGTNIESPKKDRVIFILLSVLTVSVISLLVVGPFFRGLFFPRELILSNILVFGLLILWGIFRFINKDNRLLNSPLEICLTVFLLAYTVSFFFAVNQREALTEVLRNTSYLVFYFVSLDISRFYKIRLKMNNHDRVGSNTAEEEYFSGVSILVYSAIVSATLIALASIAIAIGHWDLPAAYEGNRIASPIGYSNTAAAYLMASYLLILALIPVIKERFRYLLFSTATILMIVIILTFSRGAWLLIPPLSLLLIIFSLKGERLRALLNVGATLIPAVPIAFWIDAAVRSSFPYKAWLFMIIATFISAFLGFLIDWFFKQLERTRKIILFIGSATVVLFFGIYFLVSALSPLVLEKSPSLDNPVSLKQVIENIEPGTPYNLSLEIAASGENDSKLDNNDWALRVLSGFPDYTYQELLSFQGKADTDWQEQSFSISLPEDIKRLEIEIYNLSSTTELRIQSVRLSSPAFDRGIGFYADRLLPERFYDRVYSFGRDVNMERRFELFGDAIKVIKDYPIIGLGGGGWASVYKSYIDTDYNSKQVHNQFLQVWIEAGIFGFLSFVGLWVVYLVAFLLNRKNKYLDNRQWQIWLATLVAALALGFHSVIDWNFAMTSVGYYLFAMLGVGMSMDKVKWFPWTKSEKSGNNQKGMLIGIASIIAGLALLLISISLFIGLHATWRSQELVNQKNYKAAITEMDRAINYDPLRAENYYNMNVILEEQTVKTNNPEAMQQMIFLARRAYELEPYNLRYVLRYGQILLNYVEVEQGIEVFDHALTLNPFSAETYIFYAFMRLNLAEYYLQNGRAAEAEHQLEGIADINNAFSEYNLSNNDMMFVLGRTSHLLGDDLEAVSFYNQIDPSSSYYNIGMQYLSELQDSNMGEN